MKKRKMLTASVLTLCAVALVAGSVLATVAYLTSSASVSNTFTVGNVGITMDESKVDTDGVATGTERVIANAYHLVPNKTYTKDPTIHITSEGSEMILFVKSRNQIRSIEAGNYSDRVRDNDDSTTDTPLTMREQMLANGWVEFVRSGDGMEIVWVYGTRDTTTPVTDSNGDPVLDGNGAPIIGTGAITPTKVSKGVTNVSGGTAGDFKLCDNFTIYKGISDLSPYAAAQVNFFAYAIQDDGFGTLAGHDLTVAAWNAVKDSITYETGIVNPMNPYKTDAADPHGPVAGVDAPVSELLTPPTTNTTGTNP